MADQDYFVALTECHFMNPQTMSEIGYYPGMARWWASDRRCRWSYTRMRRSCATHWLTLSV